MSEFGGDTGSVSMNTSRISSKAEQLMSIVTSIANKIYDIDNEITTLVTAGIEGSAVQTMANTYLKNREVIDDFVKRFAAVAVVLDDNATANKTINEQADTSASGSSK